MAEAETPRITELHVRMDCNGCEHKIRKTLRAIDGVSEVYVDLANHKVTVVGIADPERIVRAIRKTKRVPTICSHTDPAAPPPEAPPAEGEAPPPPPADEPPPPRAEPAPENNDAAPPPAEAPAATEATVVHMVHDYPYSGGHHGVYRPEQQQHWAGSAGGHRYDAAPYYSTAQYSYSHRASPHVSEYGYVESSPVHEQGRYYGGHDYYPAAAAAARDRGKGGDGGGSHITSMFSDENPNACNIA